ncbi:MAG: hypothetical protein RSD23_06555 [Ruthenibacterium sp.]
MAYKFYTGAIDGFNAAIQAAARETMEALKTEVTSAQVVPFDTGDLQRSLHVQQEMQGDTLHTALVTDGPQARRLYFHPEYHFQVGNNPNAGGAWYEPWTAHGSRHAFVPDTFAAQMRGRKG